MGYKCCYDSLHGFAYNLMLNISLDYPQNDPTSGIKVVVGLGGRLGWVPMWIGWIMFLLEGELCKKDLHWEVCWSHVWVRHYVKLCKKSNIKGENTYKPITSKFWIEGVMVPYMDDLYATNLPRLFPWKNPTNLQFLGVDDFHQMTHKEKTKMCY